MTKRAHPAPGARSSSALGTCSERRVCLPVAPLVIHGVNDYHSHHRRGGVWEELLAAPEKQWIALLAAQPDEAED